MTPTARRVLWRARFILLHNWLGRPTDDFLLEWARFIVRINGARG